MDGNDLIRPLLGRDQNEEHRASTPLELLFDLVVVIAIAAAASGFHHQVVDGHLLEGLIKFGVTFFGTWWAWVNFSWFSSAFDNDDALYRVIVMGMMSGALILAAGVKPFFTSSSLTLPIVGFVVMRLCLIALWMRVARHNPQYRRTATWYSVGLIMIQSIWVMGYFLLQGTALYPFVAGMILVELLFPFYSRHNHPLPFHKDHIVERHGLFMLIVLGETLLSVANDIQKAATSKIVLLELFGIIIGGLILLYTIWWMYFSERYHYALDHPDHIITWTYGHMGLYASVAMVGAGIAILSEQHLGAATISRSLASACVAVPTASYLAILWLIHDRYSIRGWAKWVMPAVAATILTTMFFHVGIAIWAVLMLVCLTLKLHYQRTS